MSEVAICNFALQALGASRITSLLDDNKNAKECNAAYETIRDIELRKHRWSFAKKRVVLAADVATPAFDFTYQYTLPTDCLFVIRPLNVDWEVAGRKILTDDSTVNLKYIARIEDTNEYDATFEKALGYALALHLSERITQSNTKKTSLYQLYEDSIVEARKANAFELESAELPDDDWITARL